MDEVREEGEPDWPLRTLLLFAFGALCGLFIERLTETGEGTWIVDPWRIAAASAVAVGGIVFGFSLARVRPLWAVWFALAAGAVVGLVARWNGPYSRWGADEGWQLFASVFAVAIAVPLFQSVRDAGRWQLDRRQIHVHAWTNIVLWFAAWAFVAATFLLAQLLAELFGLIGIQVLRDLLREEVAIWMLVGGALGASIGLLRDRDRMLVLLQRIAAGILSVLAPVLAAGLVLFVLSLPFTGLEPLWEQTKSTTPILLSCMVGAVILLNATIGNAPAEEAKLPVIRWSAAALACVLLPIGVVAAVSTGKRLAQHGLTPDRLWAVVFLAAALAFALAYLWAVVKGRRGWPEQVRRANVGLALAMCAAALLLATPLVDFGAISTRDQLARLQSGRTPPDRFDWAAMAFDFGPSGRRALERLREHGPAGIAKRAREALLATERWPLAEQMQASVEADRLRISLRVVPRPAPVPEPLRTAIAQSGVCSFGPCTLVWEQGAREGVAVGFPCETCAAQADRLALQANGSWQGQRTDSSRTEPPAAPDPKAQQRGVEGGQVEVRTVPRRQLFIGGEPVGPAFE